ncbi:MAG: ABC transporter permease [Myxococcota bacterium]
MSTSSSAHTLPRPDAADAAAEERARPSAAAVEWGVISALWRRDMLRLLRERSRWIGVVLQPLIFWALLGAGMSGVFRIPGLDGVDYLTWSYPGILVMVVLFTTVFATMAVIEDRQHGFLQQILVGPASRAALVAGKTAGVTTVALVQALLCLLAAPLAGYALSDVAWLPLLAALVTGCVGLVGLGFSLAWVVGSTHGYHAIMAVLLLPLWMVSGAMFPPQGGWMDAVMAANPMTWMVDGVRHALHGGVAPASVAGPGTALLALLGFAVAAGGLAVLVSGRHGRSGR